MDTESAREASKSLDGIALLLVVGDKADVAAVSVQKLASIEFYYAKNRPCTTNMIDYIDSILGEIKDFERSKRSECIRNIVRKAASMCLKKIRNRIGRYLLSLRIPG